MEPQHTRPVGRHERILSGEIDPLKKSQSHHHPTPCVQEASSRQYRTQPLSRNPWGRHLSGVQICLDLRKLCCI